MTPLAAAQRLAVDPWYDASPECAERKCQVMRMYDVASMQSIYQHGQNPEAVLIVERYSLRHDPAEDVRRRFREFAERCHRYDDEGVTA